MFAKHLHFIAIFFFSLVGALCAYFHVFKTVDNSIFDSAHYFYEFRPAEDILIIEIDELSIEKLGAWPWGRGTHAKIVDELKKLGVKYIAFDVLFSEINQNDVEGDLAFVESIRHHGNVALPLAISAMTTASAPFELTPAPLFYSANPAVGHVHIHCDYDSLCRSVFLKEGVGGPHWSHLSLALLQQQRFTQQLPGERADAVDAFSPRLIYRDFHNYLLFPKQRDPYISLSAWDVVNGKYNENQFRGFSAFVGATAVAMNDEIATPTGLKPGVIVNALVYQQLRNNTLVYKMTAKPNALLTLVFIFCVLVLLSRLNPIKFLLATLGSILGIYLLSVFWIVQLQLWIPSAAIIITLLVFYPLWNWLKLHLALNYLQGHLSKLSADSATSRGLIRSSVFSMVPLSKSAGVEVVTETIAEIKKISMEAEENRFLVESTLSSLQEAVIVTDEAGGIVLANNAAQRFFNIPNDTNILELSKQINNVAHDETPSWKAFVTNVFASDEDADAELSLSNDVRHSIQRVLYCNVSQQLLRAKTSEAKRSYVFTFTDISSLKYSEKSKLDTLNFLSHDLRAPMVSILALINNLRSGKNQESLDESLSQIKAYAEKNLEFSESILQLSRAEGVDVEGFYPIDFHSIIDAAYYTIKAAAIEKNISIQLSRTDDDLWVNGNSDLLERMLQNLLSNAIKYSSNDSEILFSVEKYNTQLKIVISDHGVGVDPEDLHLIFERFQTGTARPKAAGAGLGLFFVKTVVDKHHGSISASSVLGEGSSFTVYLPLSEL